MGLSPSLLYDLTFREFGNAVRGRYKAQEAQQRVDWERTRWQTALLLNVHTKKGSNVRPKDLAVFPWEEKPKTGIHTGWAQLKAIAKKNGEIR